MAAGRFVVPPYFPARNRDFDLLSGAKLYVYDNLTTDKANIYTDEALTVLSANPVIANSSGQFPAIWAQAGTEAEPVLYSVSVTTSTGASPGNPFNFDNYRPSVDWETAAAALAEAAAATAVAEATAAAASADEAAADAVLTAADLAAIEAIIADAPDAPSVLNKLNRDGDNATAGLMAAIGEQTPDLTAMTAPIVDSDILSGYRSGLKRFTASVFADYIKAFFSASGGSALVGFINSLTGSIARTLQARGRDTVNVRDLGCMVDGVTNDTTAFNAAITNAVATKRTLVIPAGSTMKINGAITNTATWVSIKGEPGAEIDMSGGGNIVLGPGPTQIANLSANIVAGTNTLTFVSPHGLVEGDVVLVWNPTDFSQAPFRAEYHAGKMFQVAEVVSTTVVRYYGTARKAFAAASVQVWKLTAAGCCLEDITINPNATGITLQIDGFSGVRLNNVRAKPGSPDTAIDVYRCYDIHADDAQSKTLIGSGGQYPLIFSNSQKIIVGSPTGLYSKRHCVAFGGRSGNATVPTSDAIVYGAILETISSNGIGSADIHGGCEDITYDNCILEGAMAAGVNPTYRNCTIYGRDTAAFADGTCVVGSEVVGGIYTFENCKFVTFGNTSTFGFIYLDVSQRTQDLTIVIRNATVSNPNAATRGVHLDLGSASPPAFAIHVNIDGFTYTGSTLAQLVSLSGSNNVTTTLSGYVSNLAGDGITSFLGASLTANYNVPIRWPGTVQGVATQGDVSPTVNARVDVQTQYFNTPLTANRAVSFNAGTGADGDIFRIVRGAGATGAFSLSVLGSALAVNQQATVQYIGGVAIGTWTLVSVGNRT